jgi:hypothetical protein
VRPVRDQDGVRDSASPLDIADDFGDVVAEKRLAAGNLDDTRIEGFHITAVIGGLEIAGFVAWSAMVAVLAVAGTRVGHFERNDYGSLSEPVQRPSPDDP